MFALEKVVGLAEGIVRECLVDKAENGMVMRRGGWVFVNEDQGRGARVRFEVVVGGRKGNGGGENGRGDRGGEESEVEVWTGAAGLGGEGGATARRKRGVR